MRYAYIAVKGLYTSTRTSLWRMGTERTFALAIALDHLAEKRLLDQQLSGYESRWRLEEVLARIIDDELS